MGNFQICISVPLRLAGALYITQKNYIICNFQSTKSSVELNSLFLSYIIWFDETQHWRPSKRDLYIQSYRFFETIA